MSILMIIGFLISTILGPISFVFFEVCEIVDSTLHDEKFFDEILEKNPNFASMNMLKVCLEDLGGDGEFLREIGVQEILE